MIEIARIEAEKIGKGRYRFVLRSSPGESIAASAPFNASEKNNQPERGTTEQTELELFVNMLRRSGWVVAQQPASPWYAVQLAKGTDEEIAALKRDLFLRSDPTPPSRSTGMSVQKMWIITLLVIIALFACCVVLAFTTELRITPGSG
jgi:hypothetical protein